MIENLNNFAFLWWSWMIHMFWQVGILIIVISGIDLLIRKRVWPQVRYAMWLMILVKLIMPPSFALPTSLTSNISSIFTTLSMIETESSIPDKIVLDEKSIVADKIVPSEEPVINKVKASSGVRPNLQLFLLIVWGAGLLVFAFLIISKLVSLRTQKKVLEKDRKLPQWFEALIIRCARKLSLQVIPKIVISEKVVSPAIFGVFRPALFLSDRFLKETPKKDIENILLHEMAHIKRRDTLVKQAEMVLMVLYWFNPLLWGVRKQLQHLRELCCDSTIANILQKDRKAYRTTLLETAKKILEQPLEPGLGFLGLFENSDRISSRIKWLDKDLPRHKWIKAAAVIGVSVFIPLCILPMSSGRSVGEIRKEKGVSYEKKNKLDFGIRANNSEGNSGIFYSYGHVKVNWGDAIIETDSIKIDQNLNVFETKHIQGKVSQDRVEVIVYEKLRKKVEYRADQAEFYDEIIYLKGSASLSFDNVRITSPEIIVEFSDITIGLKNLGVGIEEYINYGESMTPLMVSIKNGQDGTVKNLIEKGTNINEKDKTGGIPLMYAIAIDQDDIAKLLVDKGADINAKDKGDRTPIMYAVHKNKESIVKLLIDKGADINVKDEMGRTPLMYTVDKEYVHIAKLLIGKGADVNAKDRDGRTPLSIAKDKNQTDIIGLLIKKGAK